jgi:hypothetical protein
MSPLLAALAAIAPGLRAGENELEVGTLMSHYVWRGLRLSEGPVYQASVNLEKKGFSFNVWGNYDFRERRLSETDVTFSYHREIDKFTLATGFIHYAVTDQQDSDELYVGLGGDFPLQPEVTLYCDVNAGTGAFLQGSVGHSIALGPRISLDLKASVGAVFHNGFMGKPDSSAEFNGLYNAEILVACPIKLSDRWTLQAQFGASTPLGSNARQAIRNGSTWNGQDSFNGTVLYGGATFTFSF